MLTKKRDNPNFVASTGINPTIKLEYRSVTRWLVADKETCNLNFEVESA